MHAFLLYSRRSLSLYKLILNTYLSCAGSMPPAHELRVLLHYNVYNATGHHNHLHHLFAFEVLLSLL